MTLRYVAHRHSRLRKPIGAGHCAANPHDRFLGGARARAAQCFT